MNKELLREKIQVTFLDFNINSKDHDKHFDIVACPIVVPG